MVQLSDCVNNFEFEKAYMQKIQEQDRMCTCVCIVAVSTLVLASHELAPQLKESN